MRRSTLLQVVLASLVTVLFVGCGETAGPTGTVKGKVTLDDAPFSGDGSVMIMSRETGQAGSGDIQADGTFTLKAPLPVGSYVAFIGPKSAAGEDELQEPGDEMIDKSLPEKYLNEVSTDITIDIVEGENEVVVAMKK